MNKYKIVFAEAQIGGSQIKLTLTLNGGQRVIFKPKWQVDARCQQHIGNCTMTYTMNQTDFNTKYYYRFPRSKTA